MQRAHAIGLRKLLGEYSRHGGKFRFLESMRGELSRFHQWADARPCELAALVEALPGERLWLLLIDWKHSGDFYVVLFPQSKSGPIAEIHDLKTSAGESSLHWQYSPTKRDGKNDERKAYFSEAFGSTAVTLSFPSQSRDIEDFIAELFALADSRLKADVLDEDRPNTREGFPEGKLKERLHLFRERNPELVRRAKAEALRRDGVLRCVCCNFNFQDKYGAIGKGFIEAHHTRPLSELHEGGEETRIEDLALVCANCHRMLHRRRPWLEMNALAVLIGE